MHRSEKGQALVEYALILGCVILGVMGVMLVFQDRIADSFEHLSRMLK